MGFFWSICQSVRLGLKRSWIITAGWFGVREKYCSGWKFTIVYDQANRACICIQFIFVLTSSISFFTFIILNPSLVFLATLYMYIYSIFFYFLILIGPALSRRRGAAPGLRGWGREGVGARSGAGRDGAGGDGVGRRAGGRARGGARRGAAAPRLRHRPRRRQWRRPGERQRPSGARLGFWAGWEKGEIRSLWFHPRL